MRIALYQLKNKKMENKKQPRTEKEMDEYGKKGLLLFILSGFSAYVSASCGVVVDVEIGYAGLVAWFACVSIISCAMAFYCFGEYLGLD